jgi:hypothetical protein
MRLGGRATVVKNVLAARDFNQMPVNPAPNKRQSGGAILAPWAKAIPTRRSTPWSRGEIRG